MQVEILNSIHPGFYESWINPMNNGLEEMAIEDAIDEDEGYIKHKKGDHYNVEYDFKEYTKEVSSRINDLFLNKINEIVANIQFEPKIKKLFTKVSEELDSPREYNFSTDRAFIKVEVSKNNLIKVIQWIYENYYDELKIAIKEDFTNYDGFLSFYPNDIDIWMNKDIIKLDHNELSTIFDILIDDGEDLTNDMIEISNEVFYEMDLKVVKECGTL
jgi:hypothetical protein